MVYTISVIHHLLLLILLSYYNILFKNDLNDIKPHSDLKRHFIDFDLVVKAEDYSEIQIVLEDQDFNGSLLVGVSDKSYRYYYIHIISFKSGIATINCDSIDTLMQFYVEITDGAEKTRKVIKRT